LGHAAHLGGKGNWYRDLVVQCEGKIPLGRSSVDGQRDHVEDLGIDGRIMLKLCLKKYVGGAGEWTG
jgi:hypothetical protein